MMDDEEGWVDCPKCKGKGWFLKDYTDSYRGRIKIETYCSHCIGLGRMHPSLILPRYRKKAHKA